MISPGKNRWSVTAQKGKDGDITWCVFHLQHPEFTATFPDCALAEPFTLPSESVIWDDTPPPAALRFSLCRQALEVLREFKAASKLASGDSWGMDFFIAADVGTIEPASLNSAPNSSPDPPLEGSPSLSPPPDQRPRHYRLRPSSIQPLTDLQALQKNQAKKGAKTES